MVQFANFWLSVYFMNLTDLIAIQSRHIKLNGTGWLTMDPSDLTRYGSKWKTTDFAAGDVLIFSMQTLHMSTTNMTDKARISCDTRWQPSSEPLDPRYSILYTVYRRLKFIIKIQ